jgi:hypothetical protein
MEVTAEMTGSGVEAPVYICASILHREMDGCGQVIVVDEQANTGIRSNSIPAPIGDFYFSALLVIFISKRKCSHTALTSCMLILSLSLLCAF